VFGSILKTELEKDQDGSHTLFTSENSTWLPDGNGSFYKPDLYVTSKYFAVIPKSSAAVNNRNGQVGVPIHPSFAKFIFEGKNVTLGLQERGKLAFYLKLLAKFQLKSHDLLFNTTNFVYIEVTGSKLSLVEEGELQLPGALDYIVSKVLRASEVSVASLFDSALKYFESFFEIKPLEAFSYLGGGRFGRVFRCKLIGGEVASEFSIKVVKLGEDGMTEDGMTEADRVYCICFGIFRKSEINDATLCVHDLQQRWSQLLCLHA
jgi:hypothetical protein